VYLGIPQPDLLRGPLLNYGRGRIDYVQFSRFSPGDLADFVPPSEGTFLPLVPLTLPWSVKLGILSLLRVPGAYRFSPVVVTFFLGVGFQLSLV